MTNNITNPCEKCGHHTANPENEYEEVVCDDCLSNAAEIAFERLCEDFHDGGSTAPWPETVRLQQEAARKLK